MPWEEVKPRRETLVKTSAYVCKGKGKMSGDYSPDLLAESVRIRASMKALSLDLKRHERNGDAVRAAKCRDLINRKVDQLVFINEQWEQGKTRSTYRIEGK